MRVKGGPTRRRKHKKILKRAKGYWQSRSSQFKKANEAGLHAGEYAFHGRKRKKRDFRTLWITRINAAVRAEGMPYKDFIQLLKKKNVSVDRKILAQIAVEYPNVFKQIVTEVKK